MKSCGRRRAGCAARGLWKEDDWAPGAAELLLRLCARTAAALRWWKSGLSALKACRQAKGRKVLHCTAYLGL
jgi:hypothetical protein